MGLQTPAQDISRYRDANPVPTSLLADDLATVPSGPGIVIPVQRKLVTYVYLVAS